MRSGTQPEDRITVAAHSAHPVISNQLNQIVFEYRQITNFSRACNGGLTQCFDVAVCLNADGDMVRVRTLSTGKLDIAYGTPGSTITWNTLAAGAYNGAVVPDATAGSGVAVISSGNNVDAVFVNGTTVKRIRSTDKGHTFPNAAETVKALETQQSTAVTRVAMPAVDIVFFTDSPSANSGAGTTLNYNVYSGGAWQTSVAWDLYTQPLGMHAGVPTPDQGLRVSTLAAIRVTTDGAMTNDYLLGFYASGLRGDTEYGLYTLRVKNAAAGKTAQWCNPQKLWTTAPQTNVLTGETTQPSMFAFAPKLQIINNQYWMTCVECSNSAGNVLYDLRYIRSADGIAWEGRQYLCGTESGWTHLVSATPTQWVLTDFLYAQVLVPGNNLFIVGYDRAYVAAATSLVGVTNASKRFDATIAAKQDSFDLPEGGEAGMYALQLKPDAQGVVDAKIGSIIREGAEITVQAGYITGDQGGGNAAGEQIQVGQFIVDQLPEDFSRNKASREVEITARDYTKKLSSWESDLWYSYVNGQRLISLGLQDSSPFIGLNGTFISGTGIASGSIDPNFTTVHDNSVIFPHLIKDGELIVQVMCGGASWANSYAGIIFGCSDSKNYFAIVYGRTANKFSLIQSTPTSSSAIIYQYGIDISVSGNEYLAASNTAYWFRFRKTHNRVYMAYSTDRANWTNVIDFTFTGTEATPLPLGASYWGLIAKGAVTSGLVFGNDQYDDSKIFHLSNPPYAATRRDGAFRIPTPAGGGFLRAIGFHGGNTGLSSTLPDLGLAVIKDDGTGNHPANVVADSTKIIYQTTLSVNQTGMGTSMDIVHYVPGSIVLPANSYLHVWIHPVGNYLIPPQVSDNWFVKGIRGAVASTYPSNQSDDQGATWVYENEVPSFAGDVRLTVDGQLSGITFTQFQLSEDEISKSFEYIATDLAAKAGVLSTAITTIVNDSFGAALDNGADGTNHMWCNNQNGTWATSGNVLTGYNASATTRSYLRSNSYRGQIGDSIVKCQLKILATGKYAGFVLRGGGSPAGGMFAGYAIYFGAGTGGSGEDEIFFTKDTNNLIGATSGAVLTVAISTTNGTSFSCTSGKLRVGQVVRIDNELLSITAIATGATDTVTCVRAIGHTTGATHSNGATIYGCVFQSYLLPANIKLNLNQFFDVTILSQEGWYQVFVNDMLVGSFFDTLIIASGEVGFFCIGNNGGGVVANWANFKVSDLGIIRDSFVVQPGTDARQAIQNLIGEERIYAWIRYDGALVMSRNMLRASTDTYTMTSSKIKKVRSDEDWFNEAMSSNENIATIRRDGTQMDRGLRTRFFQFADAQNDGQGYDQAAVPIRAGKEKSIYWEVEHAPVWTSDREDCVTLVNQDSGATDTVIIKSLRWQRDLQTKLASGSFVANQFVS